MKGPKCTHCPNPFKGSGNDAGVATLNVPRLPVNHIRETIQ
jgi:hypothetical protein